MSVEQDIKLHAKELAQRFACEGYLELRDRTDA